MTELALKKRKKQTEPKQYCFSCGRELHGVSQQLGKTPKDRHAYCLKCADIIKGRRNSQGILVQKLLNQDTEAKNGGE